MDELTEKQKRFVEEYLVDLNATQAAIRAGYSKDTAYSIGSENLSKPEIQEAIQAEMAARSERTHITQDKVLKELAKLGFSDLKSFVEWGPRGVELKDSSGLNPEDSACVSEVGETITKDGGSKRIKLHDKTKALELIGRHLGMFNDRLDVNVTTGISSRMEAAKERLNKKVGKT